MENSTLDENEDKTVRFEEEQQQEQSDQNAVPKKKKSIIRVSSFIPSTISRKMSKVSRQARHFLHLDLASQFLKIF